MVQNFYNSSTSTFISISKWRIFPTLLFFISTLFLMSFYTGDENLACDNVTNPGQIGYDQSVCEGEAPALIQNLELPSGGSGGLEYVWLKSYDGGSNYTDISNDAPSYQPGSVTQDTWYRRCARRVGCDVYDGESNWVKITVTNAASLTVCNGGTCPVDLYHWISSGDVFLIELSAGECHTVNTTQGEMYRVVHGAWGDLEYDEHITVDECGNQTWNVQPTYCVPPCNGANCQHECNLNDHGQANYGNETRLLWLEIESLGNEIREYSVVNNSSKIIEFADGTALITGIAEQIDAPSYKWEYHVKLINKRNWTEWSALGRSYKPGVAGSDNTTWSYYEVDATDSYFTGLGSHAGETMSITHNPSTYDFGFQIGHGANDKNSNYGLSGWYKFDGAYIGHGDFNGNLDNCDSSTPFQGDWAFGCGDGKRVDIYGKGIKNSVPATLNIPSASNVYQVVVEVVYKGSNPGETIELEDDNGTIYTAYRETPSGGSSSVWVYRAVMQSTSTVIYNNTTNENSLQSLVAYAFRMNVQGSQQKGVFTHVSGFNSLKTVTFDIPTDAVSRNITLAVPISELTPDGRYLLLRASAGGVSNQHIIYGPNSDLGNCCLDIVYLTLSNVPGYATELTLEIDTRNNQNGQSVNGQSYVMAGAITVDVECVCEDYAELEPPADITIECTDSTDPTETNYPTLCDEDITDATYTDAETGDCPNTITRTWTYTRTSDLITTRTVSNTFSSCGSGSEYSFWYNTTYGTGDSDYKYFTLENATFKEFTDGTAHLIGQLVNQGNADLRFSLDVIFSGRTMSTPMGSPKDAGCFNLDDSDYYYYLQTEGTLTGQGDFAGALVNISRNGPAMQLGTGANVQENLFGASGWLTTEVVSQPSGYTLPSCPQGCADFNFRLSGDADDINNTPASVTETVTQTITVQDNNTPTFTNLPADLNVDCEDNPAIVAPDFSDECDNDLEIVYSEQMQSGLCTDNYTIVRTWTATDDCGNATSANQLVIFNDTTNPILSDSPFNMSVECDAVPIPTTLTATDNCDTDVLVSFNENRIDGSCEDNYQLERIWIATDNCGNAVSHTQIITVSDMTPPVFEPLADVTLECSDDLTAPNPVANDNCDIDVTIVLNDEFTSALSCTDNYTITRIWTATDNCGNQSTLTQVATVQDTQIPTISVPADQTVSCDAIPAIPTPIVNDNCDNDVLVNFNEAFVPGTCDNNFTLIRTWNADDNCGNSATATQTITVIDSQGPEILDIPASVTVECDEFTAAPALLIQDNCDANATIILNEEMQLGVCDDNYTVIRTWTATDACGNITTAIQVVTVTDTTSPELAGIPADETVECDAIPAPANPTASDNCDNDVTIEFQEISNQTTDGSCTDNSYTLTRIWKATDNCGNVDIQQQVITVEDTTDPILGNLPTDETVECDAIPAPATLTASDNCDGNVDITFSEISTKTNDGSCTDDTYVITRTWTATDNCGNTDTYSQTINVQDTTNPVLANIPADLTINSLPVPAVVTPTATDNCDGNVTIDFVETSGEGCSYEIVRTWTATDNCGNQDVKTQTITVEVDPQAGTLDIDDSLVCLAPAGNGNISATPNGDAVVPVGFSVIYVLTKGNGLVIEQTNSTPNFTALTAGDYTIHTLLYVSDSNDPNYLDLSPIVFGTTTGFDVNALLQQGGGLLCGSLDAAGAKVTVDNCDAKIGNMVFEDINANGIMDAGEPGIEGVIVNLEGTTADGEAVFASQMTDADGKYSFDNLAPGDYKLTFIKPLGFEATYANEGGDDTLDSDADPISGMTAFENLESGEDNDTYDAGFYKTGKIGDMVFVDKNANGIMDLGEAGIPNVQVVLTGTTGNGTPVTLTTTTDADGKYSFDGLIPGSYKLTFATPTGFVTTYPNEGGNDAADSDVDPATSMTDFEDLESGEINLTYDAGYYELAKIGNFVFEDKNANGIQDAGEPGIANVEVLLTGTTGNGTVVSLTTTTDGNGIYVFENLIPGDYKLTFTSPTDFKATYANEGGDDTLDSDADPVSGMTVFENLESGEDNDTYDAGFYKTGKIGDMVFVDKNANGIMDFGEAGIEGAEVTLTGTTGNGTVVNLTTTTDADGKYIFEDLAPGTYKLTFATPTGFVTTYPNEGGDDNADSDVDPATGMTEFVTLESGEENKTLDAGYYEPAKIGDMAFVDANANGLMDAGEVGIQYVNVLLEGFTGNNTPVTLTTQTDANGKYLFDNLVPGVYKLTFTADPLYQNTTANVGGDDAIDSDVDPATGMTGFEFLESGETNLTYDAGYYVFGKIGDFAWLDCNKDGMQSPGEEGLPNVPVALTGFDGVGNAVSLTTTTDADGKYEFANLIPGEYKLTFGFPATPTGLAYTLQDQGDEPYDSDVNAMGMTDNFTLTSGMISNDFDAGFMDVEAPTFAGVPADETVECDAIPVPANPTATDNLDTDVTITFTETSTQSGNTSDCQNNTFTITRIWTAADDCGNVSTATQVITVEDTTDPILIDVPADVTVECDAVPLVGNPTATDNCDVDAAITFNEIIVDGICTDNYTIERTWTATDNCGNDISQTQIITVQDTTDPELIGVPDDVTIECSFVPAPAAPQAIDNCDADVTIDFQEVKTDGNCTDNYTLTRTWIATDNCGNTDTKVQVITVQDTTDPNIYDIPANVTVECDDIPAVSIAPFANDNCDDDVTITFAQEIIAGNCTDNYTIERTWTATDNCGNDISQTQIITVQDTTDPMLQGVPSDETVECDAIPNPANPTATDNCDVDVDIAYEEVRTDGNCEDNYTLTRTWTATDNCGNEDVQIQIITVQDTTDPELIGVPADVIVECDLVPAPATPVAIDNCDADVTIDFQEVKTDGNCADNYTLTRTWTATDNCGNTDVQVQIITVQDTTDPNLYDVPANITVECDGVPAPSTAPFANDNCDVDVAITFAEVKVDGNCADNYTLERTWTATDNCGNDISQTQIITVQDTTDPELIGVPADVTVECDLVPAPAAPQAIDNCDADVDIDFNEVKTDGQCADNYILTRTWTATDNCGNQDVKIQYILVQDTNAPNIYDIPANVTVECDAIPAPSTAPFANDNCDVDVDITFAEIKVDGNCADNYTLERTWTATDNCGNTDSGTQIITVQDTTDPILSGVPADETVECSAVPAPAQPTATDNCDADVTILLQEVLTPGSCTDNYTITRIWTATDNCGNTDIEVQVITVQDTTDPILVGVPSDETVECDAIPAPATPTASDNCDVDVNIAYEVEIVPGTCPDSYLMIRKWTATDNCGNQDVQIQNITVQDTTDPTLIGVPANVTVECDAVPALANPTATDNCDPNPIVTFNEVKIDGACVDSYTLERTWTATDACGNDYSETQIITVQDTTDPVMAGIPADVTVECDLVPAPAQPFVNDNCDADVDVDYSEVRTDGICEDTYTLTRTWIATDNCGNATTQIQVITVQDTTDPALYGVPTNITVQCDAIPLPASPTANDNCDADVEISFLENITPGACTDNYTITRVWTATDNCGNQTFGVQTITVEDTTDPVLSGVPGNITVECDAVPAPAQPTATDNCDADVTIYFQEVKTDGNCLDTYTLTRTWTATDNCGNTDVQVQVIEVQDITDPIMVGVPANVTVECDAVPAPAQPTATDNCDADVTIDYAEVRTDGACEDTYTLTRTWTATDNCGNTDVQVQVIEVQDTTDPTLAGVPADATIDCNNIPAPAQPTATDNCDVDVTISFNENIADGSCADNYTITRTWTATDNCGNSVSQTQTLTVQDIIDPIISGVPADVTVECDAVPAPAQPVATDNCDTDVDLDFTEVQTDGSCVDNYTLTRTWIATDNCGNTTTEIQVITVEDTLDPALLGVPANITVECDAIPAPATPSANDNCDTDVTIDFAEVIIDGNCADNYTIERTWTATDNCGNTDVEVQIITVQDTTDPILSGVPGNVLVECDAVPLPLVIGVDITATDNCDADVSIVLYEEIFAGSCSDNYTILRTYTATDNCGNDDVKLQIITVQDTTIPTISGVPADLIADCDDVPAAPSAGTIIVSDNCDTDVATTFSEIIQPGSCADSYTIKRIWTATDNCGNVAVATQNITVSDVTPPTLIGVPADAQVDCNSVPAAPTPGSVTATDNCDVNVYIQYFEELIDGACDDSYVLKRTWTAVDNCGNETIGTQVITVGDATGPVLTGVPADLEVECNNIPSPVNPTATDDCDTDVDISFAETTTPGACENSYILTRTWIATDNCGNETVGIQNIIVQDTQAPILAGIPTDTSSDCNSVPAPPANVTATDNCDTDVTIDFSETSAPGACANSTIITRTWIATDNCGNSISASQTISVGDASAPILANVPSNITVECDAVPAPATNITATDNCDTNPLVSFNETTTPGACTDSYTLIRTWTATDDCGNESSESQTIFVQDTQEPIIAGVPNDVFGVPCDLVPAPATPFVNDNCDTDVDLDFDEISTPDGCGYTLTRTWTATDNCGNVATASQIITVEFDAPVLSNLPTDVTVECDNIPSPITVTATSNCLPNIQVDFMETIIDEACANGYTIERTWTTNAGCGTAVSHTQTITVQDTTDPILANVPTNVTVNCNAVPAIATNITATDNCDTNPLVSFGEILTSGACENSYTLTRTWTATDACGNEIFESQIITVEDTQDPIIAGVPADVTVECDQVPAPATPIVNDNCDTDVDLDFNETSVVDGCGFIITRTWTATDNCGNTNAVSQTITVGGDEPVFSSLPSDLTVECNNVPVAAMVTASSDCLPTIEVIFSENIISGACENSYTIERTWSIDANSACGTAISHTQTITVEDTQSPILAGIPANLNVGCGNVPTPANPVATDNCDADVTISFNEIQNPLACGYELIRTWTAVDNCGNETSASQIITVEDTEDPILIGIPADATADCNNIPTVTATVTVTDNCSTNITIDFAETTTPGACTNSYTLTRTWTATDDCGNTVSASQNISVGDNTPPTLIDAPANITVECASIPGAPYVGATDNCDFDVEAILSEVETPLTCGYLITRTWTATDDCGNESTATQEVTVADSTPPSLWEIPADLTVECGNIPAIDQGVGVLDNCDPNATLDFTESYIAGSCAENFVIVRTWTAADNCGNTVSDSQYITVQDTQSPVLAGIPTDLTVDCNNVPTAAQPVATDNCDTSVDVDFDETSVANGCGYILTRTWTATDNCGNVTEASQTITVNSDTPVLSGTPADLTVECNNIPTATSITAQSICAGTVQVDFVENIISGACENSYTIERTWSIPSGCGNAVFHTQLITVEDTQAPIMAGIPANLNVACGNIPSPANPVATDNCDTDVDISFNEIQNPLACGYELIRTWTATDNCGNETSASQTITVQDNDAPILIGVPADETVNCGTVPNPATVTASDNCDNDMDVSFSETSVVDGCQTIITRTWIAIDDCGNEVSESQVITINSDPATLSAMPSDFTVECSNVPAPADISAFDGCTGTPVQLDFVENIISGACENSYTIERTWSVLSSCGSGVSYTQTITVEDTTDPTLNGVPADVDVDCGSIPTAPIITATDNCDTDVDISFNEVETPAACGYVLTRTWTAIDNCGNEVSASQIINVGDNTPPVVAGIPADLTVECNNIPTVGNNPIATDNCDADVVILYNEIITPGACTDSYSIERIWTAIDDCGNITEAIQTISVQDITGPTLIGIPSNLTVDLTLGQTIPSPPNVIGSDNCDTDVEVTFEENQTGSGCSYLLERTWTAIDNCGNEVSATQTIEVIGGLNVTETHADASCGENNGSIDLTVSGGVAPITFVWSNGAGNIEDLTDLAPGIYEVTITDGTGCAANLSIEILGTGALQVDVSATMVSCYDGNDGSINVTMVNGLAPFTYDWTGGIGNVPNPTNLTSGSYNVTITDANGCSVSTGANVNQPQALTLTIDSNGGGCNGGLGSATANVDGGIAPYQYAWSTGETTATINNLAAGTYTVTITDNNGCTIEDEVTITASSNLIVSIDKTDVSCYLEDDGTATASATGGQPNFTYLWSNGNTNANIINLEAGIYTVTITDGTGCTGTQTIEIISPPELQLTTVSTEVTPIGNDGTATVTATGGTLPYQYIWSNGQMTATATGLSVGTYSVTVIDDNGCFAVDQVEVNSSVPLGDVNIGDYVWFDTNRDGIQDAGEVGFNNVMVKLMTAGLDGTFGTLDDEIVATETTGFNPSMTGTGYYLFENVLAGTYQIEFMASSLPSDYMFSLANQGGDDNLDSDANPLTGRTATFTVVAGQMDDLNFDAGIHPECNNVNTGGAIEATQTICSGDTPDLLVNSIYPIGGGGDLEYIWLTNTTGSPFSNTDPNWTIIQGATDEFYQPGQIYSNTYFIRCSRRAGCTDYVGETNIVAILVTPLPTIQIEQAPSSLCISEEGSFQAAYAGATATYFWDFGAGASPQTSTQRNVYNLTYSSTGIKTVTLTVENMGCSISTFYELEVINCLNNFEFTNFSATATPNGTEVFLDWTTRYEVNNSRYFLEHSKNGDDFQTFELRNANGSAQEFNDYQGVHAEPYYGVNYYRVKYVDAHNDITYSKVEVVVFDNGTRDIHVYPNPVVDFTYVEFLTELTEDATIEVVDMTGRVLQTQVVADGFRTYRVSLANYPAGTYLIWVRYNDYRKDVERVVKITD